MYFFLASLGFIVSWFIIVFLSFCFPFPYPFYLAGAIYLVVMHAKFLRLRFFACLRLDCFVSLLIVHLWELAAVIFFLFRVVFASLLSSRSFAQLIAPFYLLGVFFSFLFFFLGVFICFVSFMRRPFEDLNRLLQAYKISCRPGRRGIGAPWHSSLKYSFIPAWPGEPSHNSARYALIPLWPAELAACRALI